MELFDKIVNTVKKTADSAVKVSTEAVEYTKTKVKLSQIKAEIEKQYVKIGEMVYLNSAEGVEPQDDLNEIIEKIKELKEKAGELEAVIGTVTNKKTCPVCDAKIEANSSFCSSCGEKIE